MAQASSKEKHQTITESLLRSWLTAGCLFRRAMEPFFAKFDITGAQWAVLHCLHRARLEGIDEVRMADLVGRLLVRPPSVTTVVQRLTQLGLIVGQRSSIDQRAKCIALTPAGCRLVARVLGRRDEQIEQMFRCLSERQRSQLTELLEQFTTHLSGLVKSEA